MQGIFEFRRALRRARDLVDREPLDARHRGDRLTRLVAVHDEERPDQVVGREHVLAHHPPRPVGAAVAPHADGQVERGGRLPGLVMRDRHETDGPLAAAGRI